MDYFETGFSVRTASWHAKELLLDEHPEDWDAARVAAGLMWEPVAVPAFGERQLTMAQIMALAPEAKRLLAEVEYGAYDRADAKYPVMVAEDSFQRIIRDDTGDTLAVPTDSYSLISHADMGDIIEAVMGSDANVKFETAGSVRDGKQVWALVRLDEPFQVPGDTSASYAYLVLLNAHDGSASCSVGYTTVRVVCWNTWSAADAEGARSGARHVFRHTGDVQQRIAEAKQQLGNLRASNARNVELFTELAKQPVNADQVRTFTELFLPSPRDTGELCSDRVHANVVAARGLFTRNYETSPTMEGIAGNAYGLFMGATEYLDHIRKSMSKDSHLGRTILSPQRVKGAALNLVREVVLAA